MKLCQVEDQYKKFPTLKRDEVKKLMDWCQKQAHLPKNITGKKTKDLFCGVLNKIRDEPFVFRTGSTFDFAFELQ